MTGIFYVNIRKILLIFQYDKLYLGSNNCFFKLRKMLIAYKSVALAKKLTTLLILYYIPYILEINRFII